MGRKPRFIRIVLCTIAPMLLALFGTPALVHSTPVEGGVLRLAMSGAFQPFSTTDTESNLVGFDADIAREIGIRLGYEPQLVQTDWAGIQAGLQSGMYELICGSMAITDSRLETMHFTLPYYVSGAQVFIREGLTDLEGTRFGVTEDSTYARYIEDHPEQFPGVSVVSYGSEAEIVTALNAGWIDAFVSDLIVGGFYIKHGGGGIVPHGDLLYHEACGIAARKDSGELVRRVNGALFEMIQDGTYSEVYRRWVGVDPDVELLLASWGDFAEHIPPSAAGPSAVADDRPTFADTVAPMMGILGRGAVLTLQLSLLTAVLALVAGAIIGVGSVSRNTMLRGLANGYIWFVRGTPLLVQLFISYFVLTSFLNQLAGREIIGAFGAALIALVVNTTAYNAETLRGGIGSIGKGQWDAAASIGMTRARTMRRVILPQALRDSLPSLGNNLVVLIKDTSLVGAITLIELTYSARNVVFQTGQALLPFLLAAGFYLVIISLVSVAMKQWERHSRRSEQSASNSV